MCSVSSSIFYVEYFDGLKELTLPPASTHCIDIIKKDIHDAYCKAGVCAKCAPNEKVIFILHDNFGRKYTVKTDLGISAFED